MTASCGRPALIEHTMHRPRPQLTVGSLAEAGSGPYCPPVRRVGGLVGHDGRDAWTRNGGGAEWGRGEGGEHRHSGIAWGGGGNIPAGRLRRCLADRAASLRRSSWDWRGVMLVIPTLQGGTVCVLRSRQRQIAQTRIFWISMEPCDWLE